MVKLGHSANATIIQWHVVAMFLPSFFIGNLISRFGVRGCCGYALFYGATIYLLDSGWFLAVLGGACHAGASGISCRRQFADCAGGETVGRGRVQGIGDLLTT